MKTSKILALVLMVSFAAISMASNLPDKGSTKPPQVLVRISIDKAMYSPGLVQAMHEQLNFEFLKKDQAVYTVTVVYLRTIYLIYGTYDQWVFFFRPMGPDIDSRLSADVKPR